MNLVMLSISVGILAGIWAEFFSAQFGLLPWVGFIGWSTFYAAGGGKNGLYKGIASNLSGIVWAFFMAKGAAFLGFPHAFALTVAIAAGMMCIQSKLSPLTFIPGAFLGCCTTFGAGLDGVAVLLALVVGNLFGYASEYGGIVLSKYAPSAPGKG